MAKKPKSTKKSSSSASDKKKSALCLGKSHFLKKAKDLDPDIFRRHVAYRARKLVNAEGQPVTKEPDRKRLEKDISNYFEKIDLSEDFLPARFLVDGAKQSEAVCRIVIRQGNQLRGYGTGFLIGEHYIMTNNHVLSSRDIANGSIAEFGYEDDSTVTRVALKPEGLFITNKELDFTIVECEPDAIADITRIPLLRNPATITRNERVNIIQHPSGETKQVAIHKNNVIRVKDKVIHYRTDTEPGSSGSPVFNNNWELVGLHHAGWTGQDGRSTNEGIRISSIVSHLISQRRQPDSNNEHLESLLSGINDTSPYLGFFRRLGSGKRQRN